MTDPIESGLESRLETPVAPPVVRAAYVQRPPTEAFQVFTEEIGAWWPLPTHGTYGDAAGGVVFRDKLLIEQAIDGGETVWGEVLEWDPPNRLVMTWHPGRAADDASRVTVDFEPDGDGTRVVLEHTGWEAFGADAMARRRMYNRPNAWGGVLDHYADVAESPIDGPDLNELAAAYDAFLAEATRGGFGPGPEGEWNADQILAHVALNDAAMVAVCQALVHGRQARFENIVCQDPQILADAIDNAGSRDELIARAQAAATATMAAVRRLSPDQLATEVHCHLLHDGNVMVDGPRPWGAVAIEVQAGMHLPAHITQLQNLRS